jgi:hypothetical protein
MCDGRNRSTATSLSVSSAAGWLAAGRDSLPSNRSRIFPANAAHRLEGLMSTVSADRTAGPASRNGPQASSGSARASACESTSAASPG